MGRRTSAERCAQHIHLILHRISGRRRRLDIHLAIQMQVKDVFDPQWLLNPAKVFPLDASAAHRGMAAE